jgi:glycosyltransferase involved in cell wall biosynthesis
MSSAVESLKAFVPEGCLDGAVDGWARGWVWDTGKSGRRAAVDVFLDGKYVTTVVADAFREDLAEAGKGDGRCAFEAELPDSSCDGDPHTLEVFAAGTSIPLVGSPKTVAMDAKALRETPAGSWARQTPTPRHPRLSHRSPPPLVASEDDLGFTRLAAQDAGGGLDGIAVVIPTHNRSAALEMTLLAWNEVRRPCAVEWIVVDDGSSDDTPDTLQRLSKEIPGLRWTRVDNGGPGRARNTGVAMTAQPLILFTGDDIRPSSPEILVHHHRAHCCFPAREAAVLGKITWPDLADERINFVMSHIQGIGEQQFGFFHLLPYTWLDWRFFYTSNVSLKRDIISNWIEDGFSSRFPLAGFEDGELAYRFSKQFDNGFRILYCPAAAAAHHHQYSVKQFLDRQTGAGLMAKIFEDLHPQVAPQLATADVVAALKTEGRAPARLVDEYLSVMEGIKSWAVILERDHNLGSQNWHADFLCAVFHLAYLHGRVLAHDVPGANYAAAYRTILRAFQEQLSTAASFEALGRMMQLALV